MGGVENASKEVDERREKKYRSRCYFKRSFGKVRKIAARRCGGRTRKDQRAGMGGKGGKKKSECSENQPLMPERTTPVEQAQDGNEKEGLRRKRFTYSYSVTKGKGGGWVSANL